jgi:eukaryotic-like serine/threonine-protein kinase
MGNELAADLSMAFNHLERPEEDISAQEKYHAVKNLDFFQGLSDTEIWEIIRAGTLQNYEDNQEIIVEGQLDDSFYIIVSGEAIVRKGGKDIRTLTQGNCFGEMGCLAKTKRSATVVTKGLGLLLKNVSST